MRKSMLLLLALAAVLTAGAQKSKAKARLTPGSVVKDTSGVVLSPDQWVPLFESGKVKVDPVDPTKPDSEFRLSRYSEQEWGKRMEAMPRPLGSKAFRRSSRLADFEVTDLQGATYCMGSLKGKVVVLNFWFINCPPCRLEIPELNELVAQYKDQKDVVFLGIAMDDEPRLRQFLAFMPFKYHIIANGKELAEVNKIGGFPTHVVLDREGRILFHTDGLAQNTVYWVKKSIEKGLSEPPAPKGEERGR